MSNKDKTTINTGIGFTGLCWFATIIFTVLKLAGIIAWPWWIVFLPAMIGMVLIIIAIIILFISIVVCFTIADKEGIFDILDI